MKRKFGVKPPLEWESALAYLTDDQLRHGMESLVKSGGEHVPSLPAFLALCRQAREWSDDPPPAITGPIWDKWLLAANRHLIAYLMAAALARRVFRDADYQVLLQFKNAWAEDMRADDKGAGLEIEAQQAAWRDCMARAEEQLAQKEAA